MRRAVFLAALLLMFASAVWLVNVRFEGRALNVELAKLRAEGRNLKRENRRLQIELATFGDFRKIRERGAGDFGMVFPAIGDGTMIMASPRR